MSSVLLSYLPVDYPFVIALASRGAKPIGKKSMTAPVGQATCMNDLWSKLSKAGWGCMFLTHFSEAPVPAPTPQPTPTPTPATTRVAT